MNQTIGMLDLACIQAVTELEHQGKRRMDEQERLVFKLGFINGAQFGIELAKQELELARKAQLKGGL